LGLVLFTALAAIPGLLVGLVSERSDFAGAAINACARDFGIAQSIQA
jgi:hypothetical protein